MNNLNSTFHLISALLSRPSLFTSVQAETQTHFSHTLTYANTHIHKSTIMLNSRIIYHMQIDSIYVNLLCCVKLNCSPCVHIYIHSLFHSHPLEYMHSPLSGRQVGGLPVPPLPACPRSAYLLFASMSCLCAAFGWSYSIWIGLAQLLRPSLSPRTSWRRQRPQ